MKNYTLAIILFLVVSHARTQPAPGKVFYMVPQLVLLNGDHSASGQVQLTGGIQKNNWCLGAGVGIDYYKLRSIPLFADAKLFLGKSHSLFTYANLGCNMAWPLESQYRTTWLWTSGTQKSNFSYGLYTDLGIGYAITGKQNKGIMISLGYSIKTLTETYFQAEYADFPISARINKEYRVNYSLNRVALKLGFGF
jgi:hypothetical protein